MVQVLPIVYIVYSRVFFILLHLSLSIIYIYIYTLVSSHLVRQERIESNLDAGEALNLDGRLKRTPRELTFSVCCAGQGQAI